jgi:GNAT superfamily N-acetyltransferase
VSAHPPDLTVRISSEADIDAIATLRARWEDAAADTGFTDRLRAWLAEEGTRRTTWLAESGAQAVGMVSLFEYRRMPLPSRPDSRWGYVANMFVRDDMRGRGIGTALLAALTRTADERQYARLVLSPSSRAVPLFERAGFVSAGASEDALLLVRLPGTRECDSSE